MEPGHNHHEEADPEPSGQKGDPPRAEGPAHEEDREGDRPAVGEGEVVESAVEEEGREGEQRRPRQGPLRAGPEVAGHAEKGAARQHVGEKQDEV